MFDRVGGVVDDDAFRRHAVSLALTSTLCGVAIGGLLLGTQSWAVVAPATGAPDTTDEQMVTLHDTPTEDHDDAPLPALPHPPAPAPRGSPKIAPATDGETEVEHEPGTEQGGETRAGAESPAASGEGACTDCTPPGRATVRRMVQPEYPAEAQALGLADRRCTVRVEVDERGVPDRADVSGCPDAFHRATREAVLQWRWYPPRAGGVLSRVAVTVAVNYRMPL